MVNKIKADDIAPMYSCIQCNYYTCNNKDLDRHLITKKHLKNNSLAKNENKILVNNTKITIESPAIKKDDNNKPSNFLCECGKKYKLERTYLRHCEKCMLITQMDDNFDNFNVHFDNLNTNLDDNIIFNSNITLDNERVFLSPIGTLFLMLYNFLLVFTSFIYKEIHHLT